MIADFGRRVYRPVGLMCRALRNRAPALGVESKDNLQDR